MKTLLQMLNYIELTSTYRAVQSIQDYPLTGLFYTGAPTNVETDEVSWISFPAVNTPASLNNRSQPAKVNTFQGGTKRKGSLFYAFNETPIDDANVLLALREPESYTLQNMGMTSVQMVMEEQDIRHRILKEVITAHQITYGRVYYNEAGDVLVPTVNSSTGAFTDPSGAVGYADFGWADTQRGNLNSIISAQWSTAGTAIATQLDAIKNYYAENNLPEPTEIIVNPYAKRHLRNNTQFETWAKENNVNADTVLRGGMIENLWGWNWHFVGGTYVDGGGTTRHLIPHTHAVFSPPFNGNWKQTFAGAELVPSTLDIVTDVSAAVSSLKKTYGKFAYAKVKDNPVRLSMFTGERFGMLYKAPNCIRAAHAFAS